MRRRGAGDASSVRPRCSTREAFVNSVLVVDDDAVSRLMLGHMLRAEGLTVTEASSAEEAATLFAKGEFALVLSDYEMPGENGLGLLAQLLTGETVPRFVLITGHQERNEFDDPLIDKVDAFLTKPVASHNLRKLLDELQVGAAAEEQAS